MRSYIDSENGRREKRKTEALVKEVDLLGSM